METTYKVTIELTAPMLGTVPKDREIYETYILSRGEDNDDEMETVPEDLAHQGTTGFHTDPVTGEVLLMGYVIKGMFKEIAQALRYDTDSLSSKLTAYKKKINMTVFIAERRIPIVLSEDLLDIQRPLRAQTPRGERVALARSDAAPEGSRLTFHVIVRGNQIKEAHLSEWLEYGRYYGLGQWRNAGNGTFSLVEFHKMGADDE